MLVATCWCARSDSEYEYESADEYGSDRDDASMPDGSAALTATVAPASPLLEATRTGSRDCRMVPAEEIETEMRRNVREIASVLAVPEDVAEALCVDHKCVLLCQTTTVSLRCIRFSRECDASLLLLEDLAAGGIPIGFWNGAPKTPSAARSNRGCVLCRTQNTV